MSAHLPWSPRDGQSALRVIDRRNGHVLCEDKGNPRFRFLYTAEGACVWIGGQSLTLTPKVMKPEPEAAPPTTASAAKKSSHPPQQLALF